MTMSAYDTTSRCLIKFHSQITSFFFIVAMASSITGDDTFTKSMTAR
jgi:hypothetical protein